METWALVAWTVTAVGGLAMAGIWMAKGGARQQDRVLVETYPEAARATEQGENLPHDISAWPLWLVALHTVLGIVGFIILFVVATAIADKSDNGPVWVMVAIAGAMVRLGLAMFRLYSRDRRQGAGQHAEQSIPLPLALGHGVAAAVTVILVVLLAAGVGD